MEFSVVEQKAAGEKLNLLLCLTLAQVKIAYVNFVNHCYVDTEVEMKEIYTSNHIWKLFENFLVDMARVSSLLQCGKVITLLGMGFDAAVRSWMQTCSLTSHVLVRLPYS